MDPQQIQQGFLVFVALVLSLSIHEASHAFAARLLGDRTAEREGRLTLNPLAHLDQLGTIMMAFMSFSGVGLGWAKPVPVDPLALRNRKRDMGLIAAAGPFSNILQALFALGMMRFGVPGASFWSLYLMVNLSLAVFNMFPVYPLDGQKVLGSLLPGPLARQLDFFAIRYGMWPLVGILLWETILPWPGPLSFFHRPVMDFLLWSLHTLAMLGG